MQPEPLSSGQEQSEIRNLITQLTQKIEQLSPAEREAVSAELQSLISCIDSLTPSAYAPAFDNQLELRQSEARYRSLFQQMSEGFALHKMIFDEGGHPVDYRFLEINPAFERLTGLRRADVVGRLKTEVLPGDTSNWIEIYGRVAQTGESIRFENYSIALRQHYEVFAYRPAPGQFATLFVNTTERKLIEFEAQEGKRLLDVIMEYVPEGITIADAPDAHIRMVSRYGVDKLGGDHSNQTLEEVSRRWKVFQADGDRLMDLDEQPLMRAVRRGETVRNMEIVVLTSSGEKLSLLCNAAPIFGDGGEITGGIVAWHDITERRRDLEALQEREAMLHGLFEAETIYAGIVELVEDDIVFVRANTKEAGFYGLTIEEMSGISHHQLGYDEAAINYWLGQYQLCYTEQRPINLEFPTTIGDKTYWFYSTITSVPASSSGNPRFAFVTIDITENKKVEEALRLSEERFRLAGMAVSGIVYDLDIVNNRVYRSDRLKDVLGYDPHDVPANWDWWKSLIHPDDLQRVQQHDRAVAASNADQTTIDYRVRHKDGHYLTLLDNAFIIRDEHGKPIRHVGSNTDITARKQSEEALRLSEERFRLASQAVQGIVYDWDIVNQTVFRSAGLEQVLGFRPEEVPPGNSWWQDRIHPEDRESQLGYLETVFSGKDETYQTEYRVQHKEGHWVDILDRSFIVRDADGKPLRMIGSSNDISDRKNYEKTLLESQRREQARVQELEALLESTPALVWIAHDPESRLITGNRAGYEVVRMQPGENVSKSAPVDEGPAHFLAMRDGKEIPTDELPVQMAAARGIFVRDYEFDIVFDDGTVKHVMGNAVPLFDEEGKPRGAVSAFMDITERKRYEASLLEAQKREQARAEELEAIMNATPAFVWIAHDSESRMMTGNRAAYESVRMQPGTNISKSAPPGERPTHFIAMKDGKEIPTDELPVQMAAAKGVPVQDYEFDFMFENGEVMSVMGNAHPLFDEQGNPRGAVSAFLNITDRKRIEEALRESEAHFALTLANTSIFLFNQDRELRYTWRHNPVPLFEDTTIGKTDYDFYNLEEADLLTGFKRKVVETGQRIRQEVTLHIEGEARIFDLILGPLKDEHGDIIGLTGAASDITQMRRLEQQQIEHETQAEVQRRLQEYRERERREIARDIHDGPIQTLMSALINIQLTKEVIDNTAIQLDLESISATVRSAVHELRDVVNQLRPPALIRFGLARSISLHAEDYHDKHPHCTIDLDLPSVDVQMPEDVILTLFRIYQEAMNNVARHAHARQVAVRYRIENQKAILEVQDNGAGFKVPGDLLHQTQMGHYGLAGMKERAETVGGVFSVRSQPGEGTMIQAVVPLDRV
jgi:PAS domain S-box-containing protein